MNIVLLIGCAVAPAIALMSFFYIRDRYDSEPLQLVGKLFLVGMLSALPVMYFVKWVSTSISSPYVHTILVVAVVEELSKLLLTYWFAVRHHEFDEEYDGIVYAVATSLGFATIENIIKALALGWDVIPFRTLFTVPGHALFGVIMGYYLGKAKFTTSRRKRVLLGLLAFGSPWLVHSTYDSLLISEQTWLIALSIPFMVGLWINGLRKVREAAERSPFKPLEKNAPDV
ncbi:PrsW family glutamic-type intramembrane protease [Tumebacillus permanentifrigoris]|uniref:Protease PrsW n=1 Tax=Tumebacillus permanentifrigoris TaxID=378543 RepID=A0A316DAJ6_9BACL|nr:PrsW family glutamic-type intramembrane protease [Tumebacillus permanentifrigoris]PWK14299.1 RsiW-degrading membrane proteinase PrsW (M82 family) [Tumebacillus permanentifrigoris]